jgi:hypothetical protein
MMRTLYLLILWLHPAAFRRRFGEEMLSIFEEDGMHDFAGSMILDCLASLARQWALRTDSWKILAALAGAFVQVWGFGLRTFGYEQWSHNSQDVTPYLQQLILITLASLCILLVMVMLLTAWTMRFQRRESKGHRQRIRP